MSCLLHGICLIVGIRGVISRLAIFEKFSNLDANIHTHLPIAETLPMKIIQSRVPFK